MCMVEKNTKLKWSLAYRGVAFPKVHFSQYLEPEAYIPSKEKKPGMAVCLGPGNAV